MHFYCEKLLLARNRKLGGALSTPWGAKDIKHGGVENLSRGLNSQSPPINSYPVCGACVSKFSREVQFYGINVHPLA